MNKTKIKELRESKGLTQIQLAEKAEVSLATIRNFEQGAQPTNRVKRRVAYALGVSLAEIGGPNVATWTGEVRERSQAEKKFGEDLQILFNDLMTRADSQEKELIADIDNFCGFQEILFLARKHGLEIPDIK